MPDIDEERKQCIKCNNYPCKCGWEYRNALRSVRIELAAAILGIPVIDIEIALGEYISDNHPIKEESHEE